MSNKRTKARRIIACLNDISWSMNLTKNSIYTKQCKKCNAYNAWRISERSKRALEATEINAMRRFMRISRREKIRNEEINENRRFDNG